MRPCLDYHDDDDLLNIVDAYAEEHPSFDNSFAEALHDYLSEHDSLTSGQREGLANIIEGFKMMI